MFLVPGAGPGGAGLRARAPCDLPPNTTQWTAFSFTAPGPKARAQTGPPLAFGQRCPRPGSRRKGEPSGSGEVGLSRLSASAGRSRCHRLTPRLPLCLLPSDWWDPLVRTEVWGSQGRNRPAPLSPPGPRRDVPLQARPAAGGGQRRGGVSFLPHLPQRPLSVFSKSGLQRKRFSPLGRKCWHLIQTSLHRCTPPFLPSPSLFFGKRELIDWVNTDVFKSICRVRGVHEISLGHNWPRNCSCGCWREEFSRSGGGVSGVGRLLPVSR